MSPRTEKPGSPGNEHGQTLAEAAVALALLSGLQILALGIWRAEWRALRQERLRFEEGHRRIMTGEPGAGELETARW